MTRGSKSPPFINYLNSCHSGKAIINCHIHPFHMAAKRRAASCNSHHPLTPGGGLGIGVPRVTPLSPPRTHARSGAATTGG